MNEDLLTPQMLEAIEDDLKLATRFTQAHHTEMLNSMIAHHMGWLNPDQSPGKRVRPLLVLLTCHTAGGNWRQALPAASAVEIIHNFSLVHDDIEDHSDTRRGRQTLWKLWGIPQAINTGDAMFALARASTKRLVNQGISAELLVAVEELLDQALLHLTLGQHMDIYFETQIDVPLDDYLVMIEGKTAALLRAATSIGGLLAGRPLEEVEQIGLFGKHLGLAFQIKDDILGIWGDPSVTGKPAGDDLQIGKKSLPVIYGLEHSDEFKTAWKQGSIDQDQLADIITLLEGVGARNHAMALADRHTQQALQCLNTVFPPGLSGGGELHALANRLLIREY